MDSLIESAMISQYVATKRGRDSDTLLCRKSSRTVSTAATGSSRSNATDMESLIESAMISQYVAARRSHNINAYATDPSSSRTAIKKAAPVFLQKKRESKAISEEAVPGAYPLYFSEESQTNNNRSKDYVHIDTRRPTHVACCPQCARQNITTHTNTKTTATMWVAVAISAIVFWPLAWVPLVAGLFKQTDHYCQHCAAKIGRVKPLGCSSSC